MPEGSIPMANLKKEQAGAVAFDASSAFGRRTLFGMLALFATPLTQHALADTAPVDATVPIKHFNEALLATMRAGEEAPFGSRFRTLAPVVDQTFDLRAVLAAASVGSGWTSVSPDQQDRLVDAFRRYTVASYVANFDSYDGQSFTISPDTRSLDGERVVVQSRLVQRRGDPTELDYVMRQSPSGWKIVDVLSAGSISRVAEQRSDFRHIMSRGGGDALLANLQRKASEISGGAEV
jgi:phospholipid transport system substrate-binding protein